MLGPLFFLMLLGVIEGGRLVFTNHELSHGTKEGGRYVMVHGSKSTSPATAASVKTAMLDKMSGVNSANLTVALAYPGGSNEPGNKALVTSTYTFQPLIAMVLGAGTITITHSSEVTIQH
jgi:Flp pilus assembly protein TadG